MHEFFKAIDFDDILNKRVKAPFVPLLLSDKDTRNFDNVFQNIRFRCLSHKWHILMVRLIPRPLKTNSLKISNLARFVEFQCSKKKPTIEYVKFSINVYTFNYN